MISQPAALSSLKKPRMEAMETSVALSLPSQKGLDIEQAINQSLDSFSQQGDAIEVDRPATVPCIESSTTLALTLVQDQTDSQVTMFTKCTYFQNQLIMYENF